MFVKFFSSEHERIVELPDDMTVEEIDNEYKEWVSEWADCNWRFYKEGE